LAHPVHNDALSCRLPSRPLYHKAGPGDVGMRHYALLARMICWPLHSTGWTWTVHCIRFPHEALPTVCSRLEYYESAGKRIIYTNYRNRSLPILLSTIMFPALPDGHNERVVNCRRQWRHAGRGGATSDGTVELQL